MLMMLFVQENGTTVDKILQKMSLSSKTNNRADKKATVLEKIINFFNKFKDIAGNGMAPKANV